MTTLERASGWVGLLVYPLLLCLALLPSVFVEVYTSETFKVSQEFLIVVLGWMIILPIAIARALAGLPVLGGGRSSWMRLALGGLVIWLIVSSAMAFNPEASWKYAGTVMTYLLVAQSVLDWMEMQPERRNFVLGAMTASLALQTVICLVQMANLPLIEWSKSVPAFINDGRVQPWSYWLRDFVGGVGLAASKGNLVGTLGNPNYVAEFMALLIPVAGAWAWTLKRVWAKVLIGLVLLGAFAALAVTAGRAAMVGLAIAALASAVMVFGKRFFNLREWWGAPRGKLIISVVAVVALVGVVVVGGRIMSKFDARGGITSDASFISRYANWQAAFEMTKDRPVAGNGLGSFRLRNTEELAQLYPQGLPEGAGRTRFMQAHNEPIQGMAEIGVVGLLICLIAFGFWCRETLTNESMGRALRWGLITGAGGLLLSGIFGFPLHIPMTALMFMLVLSVGIANRVPAAELGLGTPWRLAYALVAAAVLGTGAYQVYTKDVYPLYQGHRYLFIGERMVAKETTDTTLVTLTLADRFDRFKGSTRWKILKTLVGAKQYETALTLIEASGKEGLGKDSLYWKARALRALGRIDESKQVYQELVNYYPESHAMHKRAKRALRTLDKADDAKEE